MLNRLKRLLVSPSEFRPRVEPAAPEPEIDVGLLDIHLSGWLRGESGELIEGFAIGPEDTVLDIGCGDGGYSHFCGMQGAEIILADLDPEKIDAAKAKLQGSAARALHTLVTDANPIPLPDARVSKVIAMEVLEHVDDPAQFMGELVRVASPGAQFLLTVPDEIIEGVQKRIAPPVYFEKPNHIRIFKRGELEKLATDAGLIVERSLQYGFYQSVWWSLYWACKDQPLSPPWHPLLANWSQTWSTLLALPYGAQIKQALDDVMPKSQVIIARKPEKSLR